MVKATIRVDDGTNMLVLGLSGSDMKALQEGVPIFIDQLDPKEPIYGMVIMHAETKEEVLSILGEHLGPPQEIH